MPKKDYLIGKFKGQIEEWESEINRLKCDIEDTSEEEVKNQCSKKINILQSMILKAEEEITKLGKKFKDSENGTPAPPYLE